jgi:hypothetical protein
MEEEIIIQQRERERERESELVRWGIVRSIMTGLAVGKCHKRYG